jgi:tetratricopeptide (TPR) repeat protein
MDQNFVAAHIGLGKIYLLQSKYEEALEKLDKAWELSNGSSPELLSLKGMIHAKSGNTIEAEKMLEELLVWTQSTYVDHAQIAALFMALGQKDRAFDWLDKAYRERIPACSKKSASNNCPIFPKPGNSYMPISCLLSWNRNRNDGFMG